MPPAPPLPKKHNKRASPVWTRSYFLLTQNQGGVCRDGHGLGSGLRLLPQIASVTVGQNLPLTGQLCQTSLVAAVEDHEHDHEDETEVEHSDHDGHHHTYDPHIWTSPKNAMIMVNNILEALCEVDPENQAYYETNATEYLNELNTLDAEFQEVVANAKRDTIYHGGRFAMQYLTHDYGIHYVSAPFEAEPSAALVAQMIKEIKENNIPVIYYEELVDPKIAKMISEETGAQMLLLHSCHNVSKDDFNNGVSYLSLMKQNVQNLKVGLN